MKPSAKGHWSQSEAQFIEQILDFGNKTLADILTPRASIFFLPLEMPLPAIVAELERTRHTKVPIYLEHRDNVIGILHVRDLLGMELHAGDVGPTRLQEILRDPYFVPESKAASDLFHDFRRRKLSVALTVDEYGGVTGIVTMEDLLECIFGAIYSPSEVHDEAHISRLADGRYVVDGTLPIADFNATVGCRWTTEHAETVGGYLLHHHGELPPAQSTIVIDGLSIIVTKVADNRIHQVEVERSTATDRPATNNQ